MRPRWYWRLLLDDDPDGTAQDPSFAEAIRLHRKYAEPVSVHLFLDPTGRRKGLKRGRVDEEGNGSFGWSRSEARRVGAQFGVQDDVQTTIVGVNQEEALYVPRPGDILLHTRRLWEVLQVTDADYIGETDIIAVWSGVCAMFADDVADPTEFNLPAPPSVVPPDTRTPEALG